MAIKIFLKDVDRANYIGNPAAAFEMEVGYYIAMSEGGDNNDPRAAEGAFLVTFPVDSSPGQVFAIAYQKILDLCDAEGYPTPAKTDIYTWLPTDFSTIIPD